MIRINLLPVKAAQKKEKLRGQLVVFVAGILLAVAACGGIYTTVLAKINEQRAENARMEEEINRLRKALGEVAHFKRLQEELRGKLAVLDQLKAAKSGPVRLLDELSQATPQKLWITAFKESGGAISISGIGLNEETVAEFMRSLERSPYFQNVELNIVEQTAQGNQKLHKFDIVCRTQNPAAQ